MSESVPAVDDWCPQEGLCTERLAGKRGCLHQVGISIQWWYFEPEFDPDRDDGLAALGLVEGQQIRQVRLHGYRAWEGWMLQLEGTTIESDIWETPGARYFEVTLELDGSVRRHRVVRALLRRYRGTTGEMDYRLGPVLVVVEWPNVGRSEGRVTLGGISFGSGNLPFDGRPPDLSHLSPAFEILGTTLRRGGRSKSRREDDLDFLATGAKMYYLKKRCWATDEGLAEQLGMSVPGLKSMKRQRGKTKSISTREIKTRAMELLEDNRLVDDDLPYSDR